MGDKTGISWTESTWNWLRGCTEVDDDCANCYAKRIGARFSDPGQAYEGFARMKRTAGGKSLPQWTGAIGIIAEHLLDPVRWKAPRKIFCVSVSDPFHEGLSNVEVAVGYGVMAIAGRHVFQNLTKRSKRRREWFAWVAEEAKKIDQSPAMFCYLAMRTWAEKHRVRRWDRLFRPEVIAVAQAAPWPLPWVWEGVSAGHQRAADERIPDLIDTPGLAVRFVSLEPLIGPINLCAIPDKATRPAEFSAKYTPLGDLDWVIAGCESGPGARPCEVAWLRSLRDQCSEAGAAFFLKQATETDLGRCGDANNPNGDRPCGDVVRAHVASPDTASYSCGCTVEGPELGACVPIGYGDGSKRKAGGVIELPYLDGVQHKAFPEVSR